jgi:hypothetical protein
VKPRPKEGDAAPAKLLRELRRLAALRFMGHMARHGGGKPPSVEPDATNEDNPRVPELAGGRGRARACRSSRLSIRS